MDKIFLDINQKMSGKFICEYLHNSGNICGRSCQYSEGCFEYWRCKKLFHVKFVVSLLLLLLKDVKRMLETIISNSSILDHFCHPLAIILVFLCFVPINSARRPISNFIIFVRFYKQED